MGMDQYFYRTNNAERTDYCQCIAKKIKKNEEIEKFALGMKLKHNIPESVDYYRYPEYFSDEDIVVAQKLYDEYFSIKSTSDSSSIELCYYRKAYGLHNLICNIKNIDSDNDNCTRIYLDETDIRKIIAEVNFTIGKINAKDEISSDNNNSYLYPHEYGETIWNDYWYLEDLEQLKNFLYETLESVNFEEESIYYRSCY